MLVPEDALELERQGLLLASSNGFRSISASIISSATKKECPGAQRFIEIPDLLESQATLEWLGFDQSTAGMLYQRWTEYAIPNDSHPFLLLATDHVRVFPEDAMKPEDDWRGFFSSMGISNDLVEGVMDPEFTSLRFSRTAKDWVIDSFEAKYRVLEKAHEMSKERVRRRQMGQWEKIVRTWRKAEVQ